MRKELKGFIGGLVVLASAASLFAVCNNSFNGKSISGENETYFETFDSTNAPTLDDEGNYSGTIKSSTSGDLIYLDFMCCSSDEDCFIVINDFYSYLYNTEPIKGMHSITIKGEGQLYVYGFKDMLYDLEAAQYFDLTSEGVTLNFANSVEYFAITTYAETGKITDISIECNCIVDEKESLDFPICNFGFGGTVEPEHTLVTGDSTVSTKVGFTPYSDVTSVTYDFSCLELTSFDDKCFVCDIYVSCLDNEATLEVKFQKDGGFSTVDSKEIDISYNQWVKLSLNSAFSNVDSIEIILHSDVQTDYFVVCNTQVREIV